MADGVPTNLRAIMEECGISVRQLSEMTATMPGGRVAGTQIIAARKGRSCTTGVLRRIAEALDVSVEALFRPED